MKEEFIFYFGEESVFFHWFRSDFEIKEQQYSSVEQYLMFRKARLFGDEEIAKKIMNSSSPARHRLLGKQVGGFDKKLWHEQCKQFAFEANKAKFTQNISLKKILFETAGKSFAEASPYDRIWGIGLSLSNPKIYDRTNWRGKNWAGEGLNEVRAELKWK